MTRPHPQLRAWLMIASVGLLAVDIVAFALLGIELRVGIAETTTQLAVIGMILLARRVGEPILVKICDVLEILFLFSLLSLGAALSQYWVASLTIGYHDAALAGIDAWMGFDWVRLYLFTVEHPALGMFERVAYLSIFWSPLLILIGLTASGRGDHAERFLAAYSIALVVTLSVFYIFPTQSALMHHIGHDRLYRPVTDMTYIGIFDALRASNYPLVSTAGLNGFVSFPSFHAVLAILLIWASWPIRWLRRIAVPVNLAMLVSTPVEGAHYMIDVIAGIAVGAGAIAIITRLTAALDPGKRLFTPRIFATQIGQIQRQPAD